MTDAPLVDRNVAAEPEPELLSTMTVESVDDNWKEGKAGVDDVAAWLAILLIACVFKLFLILNSVKYWYQF